MSKSNFGHNLDYGTKPTNPENGENKDEKETRDRIIVEFGDDEAIPPTEFVWKMSGQRMCSIISNTLRNVYKDYAGSVFRINNFGMPEFVSSFCAEVVNPDAEYRAFEVANEFGKEGNADKIRNMINASGFHNSKAYRITEEGVDTLSDLVQAQINQKDKLGRVRNMNQYFWERGNIAVNPFNPYSAALNYNPNNQQIFVEVQLDIIKVLRITWPFLKQNPKEDFRYDIKILGNCNADQNNPFLQLTITPRSEAIKTLKDTGLYIGAVQSPYR